MRSIVGILFFWALGASFAGAVTIDSNFNKYKVYQSDLNGDGRPDYYFHGVSLFVLIHGDIATPIALPAPESFVLYSHGDKFLTPIAETYTDAQIATKNLQITSTTSSNLQSFIANATIDPNSTGIVQTPVAPEIAAVPAAVSSIDLTRAIPAEFDVNNSGQATYKIPVITAPGSAGLVPNVSLNYSSGGGNGIAGLGWSLSAYGAISRCRQTEGVDGAAKPITWTNEDRFCLNGDRLLLDSGTYGAAGSTYKTEIDSFARVTAVGGISGHPDYFTVEYKDGIIETYGNTSDSYNSKNQLSASNSNTVLDWALSKRSDSAGNKIVYNYVKDSDGQRVDTIDYAFGATSTRGAYLQFNYESRNDPISGYVAGHGYKTGKRVNNIKSYNGTTEIRAYSLTYNQNSAYTTNDKLSRLNKVQECVGSTCSPATEFEWELPDYQLAATTYTKGFPDGISVHAMGDLNGDGISDLVWLDQATAGSHQQAGMFLPRKIRYAFGVIATNGQFELQEQLFSNISINRPMLNARSIKIIDINNDGRMDVVVGNEYKHGSSQVVTDYAAYLSIPMPDGTWKLSASASESYSSPQELLDLTLVNTSTIESDLNGDGLPDAIVWPIGDLPWDSETFGQYPASYVALRSFTEGYSKKTLNHILGSPSLIAGVTYENQPNANFTNNMDTAPILKPVNLHGDFNGDGSVDLIADVWRSYDGCYMRDDFYRACDRMDSATVIYTIHKSNTGVYDLRYHSSNLGFILDNWDAAIDLNNDGLTDIVSRSLTSGWGISLNNGLQLPTVQPISVPKNQFNLDYASQANYESAIADINGDGYQDFVWEKPLNPASLTGSSELRVKYWDPSISHFEAQEHVIGSLSYKIIQNYNNSRQDPRMLNVLRFKTDQFKMTDVNGDGIPDLVTTPNTQTNDSVVTIRLGVNTKKNINKIVSITNGLGEKKKISYERVNESNHYSRLDGINSSSTEIEMCENVDHSGVGDTYYTERICWKESIASVDATQFYKNIHEPWHYFTTDEQSLRPASPVLEAFGPMSVVTDVEVTAPSGSKTSPQQIDTSSTAKLSYYYGHAKMQAGGRGFLGFKNFTVVNRETGIRTETEYRQDWPFIGQVRKIKTFTGKGHKLSEQFNIWGFVNCHDALGNPNTSCVTSMSTQVDASGTGVLGAVKPFLRKSITETRALTENDIAEGAVISTSTETNIYDTKGNVLESSSFVTSDLPVKAISKKTVNTYDYSGSTWSMQQGRLQRLAVTANDATYGAVTRTSSFTYYTSGAAIGLLQTETIEPDNSSFTVTTTHTYNLGNRTKSVTTANSQTRQSEVAYDSRGRYVDTTYGFFTNGTTPDTPVRRLLSQVVSRDKYGTPTESRNYISTSAYVTKRTATTAFGTPYFTADSTGAAVEIKMGTGTDTYGVCTNDTKVWSISQVAGGGTSIQCSDILGRTRRAGTIGFDGTNWSLVDTEYDKLGRTLRTSAPYWRNSTERYWTSYGYDVLGRVIETRTPYKSSYVTSTTKYTNLDVEIKNPKGHIRTEKRDLSGQVIEVVDPNNGITKFAYDARGNMREMRDPALNTTTVGYDLRDRKTSMSDPDKGNWIYKYNSFGDLVCQMDGKGQTNVQRYDIAGRVFSRTDRNTGGNCDNPTGSVDKYTQWTYDTATNGLGQLASVSDSASVGGSALYQQSFTYDSFGRVSTTTTTIPGHLGALGSHYEKITYDQYGRVFQSFDAARTSASFTTNGVQNIYNAQGYLHKAVDAVSYGGTQQAYYTVKTMNARGNVTSAEYGNGVIQAANYYPETGLTKTLRADRALVSLPLQDITLDWDELGNLDWREEHGTAGDPVRRNIREDFDYDSLNRLRTWVSSGDLSANETANYNSIDNITDKTGIGNYLYGNQCGTSTNAGPHALCRAGTTNYNYDKNGNMLNDSAGRTLKYTSYDLPSEISKSSHKTEFSYGPSRARYKRVDTSSTGQVTTTLYLGSVEKVHYPDGSIQWKRNIAGVGLITQTVNNSGVKLGEAQRYLIKDHLGSLSLITDEIGAVEQSNYFDPWGRERKIVTSGAIKQWLADNANFRISSKPITTRGFTGHEQLAEVGLIHMNGRVYDGALGRFIQADPIIQDPMRVQSLNRYSYVWNNPLNATDPSGFKCVGSQTGEEECTQTKEDKVEEVEVTGKKEERARSVVTLTFVSGTTSGNSFSGYAFSGQGYTAFVSEDIVKKYSGGDLKNITQKDMDKMLAGAAANNSLAVFSDAALDALGDVGGIENLEGNPFLGAVAVVAEQFTMGIVFGDTSILSLRTTPQIEANKAAAMEGKAGKLLNAIAMVGMVRGGFLKGLPKARTMDHHLLPQQFRKFFQARGIDIEQHTITLGEKTHLLGIHGRGLGKMPGGWNDRWRSYIDANPNASTKDIYQQLGRMIDDFDLNKYQIHPYLKK
ncbi:FG-GAP-like repeat-containing protein [Cellvibrio sp. PSBB023]|uniref:FG-GAP-like repeat-containing protein n=1 Tax=Cellvibrio sp. PSBB023 TaxID=1945512 RepID=UPI00098EB651|nr:FG-GAP-like repeat-containing protein [Cellvibrio sp. PSBB023]AQT60991.1 hypothetical protein B0D95_13520 [Cellvibrio sp. PSBB023]